MVIRIGMIGISEANGHPFSFSAIMNGFDSEYMQKAGWKVIDDYLKKRKPSEFGIKKAKVTHVWTQDEKVSELLSKACHIPHVTKNIDELYDQVDAVIIARDDYETHFSIAMPFLQKNIPVFIDKPLTLSIDELKVFQPFLKKGLLMSCSGMMFAKELDEWRKDHWQYGKIKLVRGAVVNDWEKYGVHMLDAIIPNLDTTPIAIESTDCNHSSFTITMSDQSIVQIDALGNVPKVFQVDIFGTKKVSSIQIDDNFTMFKRMLTKFIDMVETRTPLIDLEVTITVNQILIAGRRAKQEKRKVMLDEFRLS